MRRCPAQKTASADLSKAAALGELLSRFESSFNRKKGALGAPFFISSSDFAISESAAGASA